MSSSTGLNQPSTPTSESSSGAKEQAKQTAGTAADEGKRVAGVAQGEAQRVASEATSHVQDLLGQATSQVDEQSRTQRDRLVGTLRTFGDDLEHMASQTDGGLAADVAHQVAGRAHDLSSHLDGREPRELLDELRGFARRRPGTFLVGALVAGVVAGRLTRGAKAAQSGSASGSAVGGVTRTPEPYGALDTSTARPAPGVADVTSPADPLTTGLDAPSSGPVTGTGTTSGTAYGDPLAGTGQPIDDPVYPAGTDEGDRR
jgi:hypothetical protein